MSHYVGSPWFIHWEIYTELLVAIRKSLYAFHLQVAGCFALHIHWGFNCKLLYKIVKLNCIPPFVSSNCEQFIEINL